MTDPDAHPPQRRPPTSRNPRPLTPARRYQAAADLLRIIALLTKADGDAIQRLRGQVVNGAGYPARVSGAEGGGPHNEVDDDGVPVSASTSVERAAVDGDQLVARTRGAMVELERWLTDAVAVLRALEADWPHRVIRYCAACGAPWDENYQRCQAQGVDGKACGARRDQGQADELDRICSNPTCPDEGPHKRLQKGRCDRCAAYWRRYGRERGAVAATGRTASVERLQLDQDELITD